MTAKLRIILAQLNFTVGDIDGNVAKHIRAAITARDEFSADVIVFPELSLTSYPPEDLLLRPAFIAKTEKALEKLLNEVTDIYCLVGHPQKTANGIYNACSLIYNGKIIGQYAKQHLPNYGVFDEYRYFIPGNTPCVIPIKGILTGLIICEDAWVSGSIQQAVKQGAELILLPNASPFEVDKHEQRVNILAKQAKQNRIPIYYSNHISGQDELVFDGGSMVINADGELSEFAGFFQETLLPVEHRSTNSTPIIIPNKEQRIYQALVLGLRDYIKKNHFPGVLVGVSGGIDSALTLTIAVDALGKNHVQAIFMPSRYTADISHEDAATLASNLGVKSQVISIEPVYNSFLEILAPSFADKKPDITEENIQSRCRAIILMALSNKFGHLVLTTGNRSEMAVGYCTLYGDMVGGFAVLKDVPKMLVYSLANYRNQLNPVIPQRTLERPPTAELTANQLDEDTLPPYPILDKILTAYLNQGLSLDEIVALGFERETVNKIILMIHKSEYKRHQAATGTHINHKSFGKDWRYPITSGFKG